VKSSGQDNVESVEAQNQPLEKLFWRELKTDPNGVSLDNLLSLTSLEFVSKRHFGGGRWYISHPLLFGTFLLAT
jgi:hypothetical protein